MRFEVVGKLSIKQKILVPFQIILWIIFSLLFIIGYYGTMPFWWLHEKISDSL